MEHPVHLSAATIGLALPVGLAIACASRGLAWGDWRPGVRRSLFGVASATALAAWSTAALPFPQGALGALLAWQLLLLALLDAERLWLPRMLTLPLIASGLAIAAAQGALVLADKAMGAAAGFLVLRLLALAYRRARGREGLGGGDAYLLAGGGAWFGWAALPTALVWAAGAGLAYAGLRAAGRRPIAADEPIPFGVFLALGIWLAWLYGHLGRFG
ncbi:MAG: A24 family peptidase [Phenylobacterium sp.]